nr:PREDICTED: protein giant isoform X2 [Bemisia tabaci]
MAEVLNMSVNLSYTNFNNNALDLRKRGRESPEGLACPPKRFKFYAKDDGLSPPKTISPATSPGILTPSPPSSLDYSRSSTPIQRLDSSRSSPPIQRVDYKPKVHAPVLWPHPSNGYAVNHLGVFAEQRPAPIIPSDLHARYSEFFDYAKNKFSIRSQREQRHIEECRRLEEYRRRSAYQMAPPARLSPTETPFGMLNLNVQLNRSSSLSPGSPVDHRLLSPNQIMRPRSAENPARSPMTYPLEPKPIRPQPRVAETYSRTRGPHSQDRVSPVSMARADSSLSGKASPLSQPSSVDVSESSSEGLKSLSGDSTAGLIGLYLDQVHPALSLTDKIINAGVTGKPTRPFKAYPKDPLFLATSLAAIDPEEFRYSQQDYYEFREKMLSLSRHGAGQSYPKMKRSGSPSTEAEGEGTKDAQYWERRRKNNEAAKRSRDARKAKEDEIAIRAAYLENQNRLLTAEIRHLRFVTDQLKRLAEERAYSG